MVSNFTVIANQVYNVFQSIDVHLCSVLLLVPFQWVWDACFSMANEGFFFFFFCAFLHMNTQEATQCSVLCLTTIEKVMTEHHCTEWKLNIIILNDHCTELKMTTTSNLYKIADKADRADRLYDWLYLLLESEKYISHYHLPVVSH